MRLQGQAALGFYPCPEAIVKLIAEQYVEWPAKDVVWMLDPCCGEGAALRQFADFAPKAVTCGVEMSFARARTARERLDQVIEADCRQIDYRNGQWDVLWFNPPYDWDDNPSGDHKVLEESIFWALTTYRAKDRSGNEKAATFRKPVRAGALFVGILPRNHMKYLTGLLLKHFKEFAVYRFPEPEYDQFRQVVVLGVMRDRLSPMQIKSDVALGITRDARIDEWVDFIASDRLPILGETISEDTVLPQGFHVGTYTVPTHPSSARPDDPRVLVEASAARCYERIMRSGATTRPDFARRLYGTKDVRMELLRPPSDAHLATFLPGGLMNGDRVIIDARPEGRGVYLIKSRTSKSMAEVFHGVDDEGTETWIEHTRATSRLFVLELVVGDFAVYELLPEDPSEAEEEAA